MTATAIFLDRDGTIIENTGYIGDPADVRLLPGAAEAIRRFARAGYLVVLVSNQSGVARGMFDESALAVVHRRVEALLAEAGAALDGAYYCPYLDGPEAVVEAFRRDSDLRKPSPGMLIQSARDLDIDLSRSWMIGDAQRDVDAGFGAGCRTIRIAPDASGVHSDGRRATHTVRTLLDAAEVVERAMRTMKDAESGVARSEHPAPDPNRDAEIVRLLTDIHAELDRAGRANRQHDFSALRLLGALAQMFALMVVLWGLAGLINDDGVAATARFALAGFLQLASLSAFATDRFR